MKKQNLSSGNKFLLIATAVLVAGFVSACKPKPKDPPFDYSMTRKDALVDALQLKGENPLIRMGADHLWKKATGKTADGGRVRIAIVGTGVDYTIPDIRETLWINTAEYDESHRSNSVDEDGNGKKDDIFGYDFYSGDNMPYDWHGHDTFVASLIAATGRANPNVVGVAPNAELMILRYLGPDARVERNKTGLDAVEALNYAMKNQARIVYFNWPNGGFSPMEESLLLATFQKMAALNMLAVIPAGNSANQMVPKLIQNLAKLSNVLVVAATNLDGNLNELSNSGKSLATTAAPAEGGVGYLPGGVEDDGLHTTSVAAGYVAGAAALIAGLPQLGSAEKIRAELLAKAAAKKSTKALNVLSGGSVSLSEF